jgi:hypothetical protein
MFKHTNKINKIMINKNIGYIKYGNEKQQRYRRNSQS